MGIKGLSPLLKMQNGKKPVDIEVDLEDLRGKRFSVDISIYLNKYVMSSRENWLGLMVFFLLQLRYHDIDLVIIFDGKHVPELKMKEREQRKEARQSQANRLERMKRLLDIIVMKCISKHGNLLVDEKEQKEFQDIFTRSRNLPENMNFEDPEELIEELTKRIAKAEQASLGITNIHQKLIRELVTLMGFSYIEAYGEAEGLASSLAYRGFVDGTISNDSDCLAYGCPFVLKEKIKNSKKWKAIVLTDVLSTLKMDNMKNFVDLCISLKCDYNTNIPGFGPKRSYTKIQEYGTLDVWEKAEGSKLDFGVLNYRECRKIFKPYSTKYCESCIKDYMVDSKMPKVDELNSLFDSTDTAYTGEYIRDVYEKKAKPSFYSARIQRTSMLDEIK